MKDFTPENLTGPERTQTESGGNPADTRDLFLQEAWSSANVSETPKVLPAAFTSQWNFSKDFDTKAYLKSLEAPVDKLEEALKQPPGHISVERDRNSSVSAQFKDKVEKDLNTLPDDVKREIENAKLKIEVVPYVPAAGDALGRYSSWYSKVSISERGVKKAGDDAQTAIYQVIGLALDGSNQKESSNPDFRNAVVEDLKNASADTKDYFRQMFGDSKSRAFNQLYAEAFAHRQAERTGKTLPPEIAKELANTLAYMRKRYA